MKVIKKQLKKWKGETMNKEKLEQLRDEIYKATGKNKTAPFANVKKWVSEARKELRKEEKKPEKAKAASKPKAKAKAKKANKEPKVKKMPARVEESLALLKEEREAPIEEPTEEVIDIPKPTIVFDKVYLQNIQFEIAGIRKQMERISKQLDKIEKTVSEATAKSEE